MEHFKAHFNQREKLRHHVLQRMAEYNGTVFLYSHSDKFEKEAFSEAAKDAGRRLIKQEDSKGLDLVELAESAGKKAFIAPPSMVRFLGTYLSSCPANEQHLAIFVTRPSNNKLFLEFFEEQNVDIDHITIVIP